MCGLVGFAGQNNIDAKKVFSFMLLVDQIRGFDSTGIASVTPDGMVSTLKRAVNSTDFLDMKKANKIIDAHVYKAIIGHNRAATKGAINTVNAHPFTHGDITLAHNGTLRDQTLLPDHRDFEVDSENICHAIGLEGIEATVKKLKGAFALTYYDDSTNTINLIRNAERPLYYAVSEDKKNLFWASESWMIYVGASKAKLKMGDAVLLPVGELLTVSLEKGFVKDITANITKRKLELYKEPVGKSGGGGKTNGWGLHKFKFDTQTTSSLGGRLSYHYTGVTSCGLYDVSMHSSTKLNLGNIYSGYTSSVYQSNGRKVLGFLKYSVEGQQTTPEEKFDDLDLESLEGWSAKKP